MGDWLGVPAAFVAWSFALYVFIVAPKTTAARILVAMLVVDGIAVISSFRNSDYIDMWLNGTGMPWWQIHQASDWAMVALYLTFIGMTLRSPMVAPLRNGSARAVILVVGAVVTASIFFLSETMRLALQTPFYVVITVSLAWGFMAAVHSWLIAQSDGARARARAFTLAFGVRDVAWTIVFFIIAGQGYGYFVNNPDIDYWVSKLYAFAVIAYVPLVAYGMLRTQLFDIDLRIKRTLKRSTVAAAFVAAYFLVSELAANYLSDHLGTVLGLLCTATLLFFLDPIQRAADRFSNAAMPDTKATPEYEAYRKLQVYESAVLAALEQGGISKRERHMLDSLVTSLGIDPQAALQLENDARKA